MKFITSLIVIIMILGSLIFTVCGVMDILNSETIFQQQASLTTLIVGILLFIGAAILSAINVKLHPRKPRKQSLTPEQIRQDLEDEEWRQYGPRVE